MTATEPTVADLLVEADRRRPRASQREIGWSEIGDCRRRAGYRLAGTEPTNAGGSAQAALGTAIHEAIAAVLRETGQPDDLVEHEVSFAGILGHLDRYVAATATARDTKTTSSMWLGRIKTSGVPRDHLWQVHGYAAGLIRQGHPVRRVALDYVARDSGECWTHEQAFDPQHVRDALAWVDLVRETPLEMLPRDHAPDSTFCQSCPFLDTCWDGGVPDRDPRSVLYLEAPDGPRWATQLEQARTDKADAAAREAEAKGALDALRPNTEGRSDDVDVGHDKALRWAVKRSTRLDSAVVRAEYEQAGARPPETVSESVELRLVVKEDAS